MNINYHPSLSSLVPISLLHMKFGINYDLVANFIVSISLMTKIKFDDLSVSCFQLSLSPILVYIYSVNNRYIHKHAIL